MKDLLFGILGFFAVGIGIIVAITNKFSKKLYNVKELYNDYNERFTLK